MGIVAKAARPEKMVKEERDWSIGGSQPPMPAWLEPRDYQLDAVDRVMKEYEAGARVVMLDAPTGTGKTAIAEMVRRAMGVRNGLYVCTTKSLQDQVVRDFDYARVLKGRSNYIPTSVNVGTRYGGMSEITCQDCDQSPVDAPPEDRTCSYCTFVEECPYGLAREGAMSAPVGVLNTSYLLAECNGPGRFAGRELVVADEADLLEGELLGFVELTIGRRVAEELGVEVPKKGSHMPTIRTWLEEEVDPAIKERAKQVRKQGGLEGRRAALRLARLGQSVARVVKREDGWVREAAEDEKDGGMTLKPVSVEDVADTYLWRHGERWLLMSGTTVSADMQADALGLEEAGIRWGVVEVPMQFDKGNRRVVYVPAGSMTRKGQEAGGQAKVMRALDKVLEREVEGNVLVHTFSYQLAKNTVAHLGGNVGGRPVITYTNARGRDDALAAFKAGVRDEGKGAILVASSMDRGIDLPGDLCRVQVVMKMPMASLGSRQVSERLRSPGGDAWYLMQTIRTFMQQCGRAVRGMDDWAVTYVLDEHFGKVLKDGKRMGMFPGWWLEALEVGKLREYI